MNLAKTFYYMHPAPMGTRKTASPASPERQILLGCARTRPEAADTERLRALLRLPLAWDDLLRGAEFHRLLPLLGRHLEDAEPGTVPPYVRASLQARRHAGRLREVLLVGALHSLLALFEANGIAAIPYKGPAFAAQVYGDPALRPCSDLDLLVPPPQVPRAKELLLAQGYQPQQRFADAAEEAAHLQSDCEYNFIRPSDRLLVEIHWRFRPQSFPFPLDLGELWGRRETVPLAGVPVPTLPLEDYLLLLCVHGAKHRWERLIWVCDIAEIARARRDLPWERIAARADGLGCGRVLLLGLLLARDLLDAPVPDAVLAATPRAVTALAWQVRRQFCGQRGILPDPLFRPLFHVGVRERLRDQVPYWKDRARREARLFQDRVQQRCSRNRPA